MIISKREILCLLLLAGSFWPFCAQAHVQERFDSLSSALACYQEQDSFEVYYATLKEFEDGLSRETFVDLLDPMHALYDFLPETNEDSTRFRFYLMHHAIKTKLNTNNYYGANQFYLRAHSHVHDKDMLDKYAWYIEKHLAGNFARLNDYEKAMYFLKKCIPNLLDRKDYSKLSRLYSDLGDVQLWLGKEELALETFKEGLAFAEIVNEPKGVQALHVSIADYYLNYTDNQSNEALFLYHVNRSFQALEALGTSRHLDRAEELYGLMGAYHTKKGEYRKALENYQLALKAAVEYSSGPKSREQAKNYLNLAKTYLHMEALDSSNLQYKLGLQRLILDYEFDELPTEDQVLNENTFTDLLQFKSNYYLQKFNLETDLVYLDSALLSIDLALEANRILDVQIFHIQSKFISVSTNKQLVNCGLNLCYLGNQNSSGNKFVNKARTYFDLSKGVILAENRTKQKIMEILRKDDKDEIEDIQSRLIHLYDSEKENAGSEKVQLEIIELNERKAEIINDYLALSLTLESIEEPYIEYVDSHDGYYIYTNIGSSPFYKTKSKTYVDGLVDSLNFQINNRLTISNKISEDLYNELIPDGILPNQAVSIIPDGKLSYLPFDILKKNGQYFIERNALQIRFHRNQVSSSPSKEELRIYCLRPNYEVDDSPKIASERGQLGKLLHAENEVKQISHLFDGKMIIDTLIDVDVLQEELERNHIFHFAGHAITDDDQAKLVIKNTNGQVTGLSLDQLSEMKNDLVLVTLSACETGLGTFKQGEGIRSLARALLNSGAQSILYSLWNANDRSTSRIMYLFYENLRKGHSKDKALQEAKMDFLKNASPEERHPYYWAGFTSAGNVEAIINPKMPYGLIIGTLLLLSILKFYIQ